LVQPTLQIDKMRQRKTTIRVDRGAKGGGATSQIFGARKGSRKKPPAPPRGGDGNQVRKASGNKVCGGRSQGEKSGPSHTPRKPKSQRRTITAEEKRGFLEDTGKPWVRRPGHEAGYNPCGNPRGKSRVFAVIGGKKRGGQR